jgi:hypothetical protein
MAAGAAKFISGTPRWARYTPATDLGAGSIVAFGSQCGVLHSPGVSGVEMGIAVGGGIYEVTLGGTLSELVFVDWENSNDKMVAAGTGDNFFGRIEQGMGGADTNLRRVMHMEKPSDAT